MESLTFRFIVTYYMLRVTCDVAIDYQKMEKLARDGLTEHKFGDNLTIVPWKGKHQMSNEKNSETPIATKLDWKPTDSARIEQNPPRPRSYAESTMSDEDYAAAEEDAKAGRNQPGELKDWGEMPLNLPEYEKE